MAAHPPVRLLVVNVIRLVLEEVVAASDLWMILNHAFQSLAVMVALEVDPH